jgi:hypothetical protein
MICDIKQVKMKSFFFWVWFECDVRVEQMQNAENNSFNPFHFILLLLLHSFSVKFFFWVDDEVVAMEE